MHFGQINLSTSTLQIKRHWDEMGLFNFLYNNGPCKPSYFAFAEQTVGINYRQRQETAPNSGNGCEGSHRAPVRKPAGLGPSTPQAGTTAPPLRNKTRPGPGDRQLQA